MYKSIKYYENFEQIGTLDDNAKYMFFIAEKSKNIYTKIKDLKCEFYGACFTQVLFDNQNYESGFLLFELKENTIPFLVKDITNIDDSLEAILENSKSIITIVDGLSANIANFLEEFNDSLDDVEVVGGGAGLLTLVQEPVIFDNNGIYQDCALVIGLDKNINLGVNHGWEKLAGPFVATDIEKNVLKSIDYKDAFEVYKAIVEKDSGKIFTDDNFFDIAKEYPFGIEKIGSEVVVRDPIMLDGNAMVLVGEMDKNSVVNILKGVPKNLIDASSKAVNMAVDEDQSEGFLMVVDCISRILYLEEQFQEELDGIKAHAHKKQLFGMLTLGEIANKGKSYIEFYNKTCVVASG
jgi:hypothetical protein